MALPTMLQQKSVASRLTITLFFAIARKAAVKSNRGLDKSLPKNRTSEQFGGAVVGVERAMVAERALVAARDAAVDCDVAAAKG